MKNKKMMLGSAILLVVLLVVGGTLAWFTAETDTVVNNFKAGTLDIKLTEDFDDTAAGNVNPGDKIKKEITIENTGTKRAYLRMKLEPKWTNLVGEQTTLEDWGPASILDLHQDWELKSDGYYYYKNVVAAGATAPKPFTKIQFAGAAMGDKYQGANFALNVKVEAIQVTNGAVEAQWPSSGLVSVQ